MTKLQKLGVRAWREKQNQVLHSHQNQGENKRRFKTRLLTYKRIIMICFTYFNAVKFPYCLTSTCGITTELWHHNPHKRLSCLSSCTGTLLQQKPLPRVSFCRLQCSFIFLLLIAVRISFNPSMPACGQQGRGNALRWEQFL